MLLKYKKLILISLLSLTILGGSIFYYLQKPKLTELQKQGEIGDYILNNDFSKKPILPIQQTDTNYQLTDSLINGPTIKYANPPEELKDQPKNELNIQFPKNYQEPITIKLDEQRFITIKDNQGENYSSKLITEEIPLVMEHETPVMEHGAQNIEQEAESIEQGTPDIEQETQNMNHESNIMNQENQTKTQNTSYLKYQSKDKRVSTYYAYQKDQSRTLKHWTIYDKQKKDQAEKEEYQFTNAKIKLNERGEVEVYYFGEQDLKNEEVKAEVDSNLMARAQRTLQKELGEDILNTNNHTPDFIIPAPYYINKNQERKTLNWEIDQDTNTLKVNFKPEKDEYPIGLDPTIQFTAPGQANSSDMIISKETNDGIGYSMTVGDFDDDGDDDLAISSIGYLEYYGRVYIFYNDGTIPTSASSADTIITGGGYSGFGSAMANGDFDGDGDEDLVVIGEDDLYIFYNDDFYPDSAMDADVIIETSSGNFDASFLKCGDLNDDSKDDLVFSYNSYEFGRVVYIIYSDGNYPFNFNEADVMINYNDDSYDYYFGSSAAIGDFDYDGDADLAVGCRSYSNYIGRVYIFYNDGVYPSSTSDAGLVITGEGTGNRFGSKIESGDFNNDSRVDLAVTAYGYSSNTGRAYIFFNDGSIPPAASSADIIIDGESDSYFGASVLVSGDFNYDGVDDLAVGRSASSPTADKVYVFYCDGSIPTSATSADATISGEDPGGYFECALAGDLNNDNRDDLIIGSYVYEYSAGRVYVFYNDGSYPSSSSGADLKITGDIPNYRFGRAITTGDLNGDGKDDLAVGSNYGSGYGRIYIFYGGESMPNDETGADAIITGANSILYNSLAIFGASLESEDLNDDEKDDLIVGGDKSVNIFYNDGSYPATDLGADVVINGFTYSPDSFSVADFNSDGKNDLAIADYSSVYIFYNDGSIPTTASSADVIISGFENLDGGCIAAGDMNNDGRDDLIVADRLYLTHNGGIFIFYNDGSIPTSASGADVIIAGFDQYHYFGSSFEVGDFDGDNNDDLVVCTANYSDYGIAIFYNEDIVSGDASDASFAVGGNSYFVSKGDLNADGRDDIILYQNYGSAIYIFYNNGSHSIDFNNADIIINYYGMNTFHSIEVGDLNADGKSDLITGLTVNNFASIYIFYSQNGQVGISNGIADNYAYSSLGWPSIAKGDFDDDGDDDLAVGDGGDGIGKVYIFYNDGSIPISLSSADEIILGAFDGGNFGRGISSGDFDDDGDDDLAVGGYSEGGYGCVYIFYSDGNYPENSSGYDVVIEGGFYNYLGYYMTSGDFDGDGDDDLLTADESSDYFIFYNDGTYPNNISGADVYIEGGVWCFS